jgi:hypothetical protein
MFGADDQLENGMNADCPRGFFPDTWMGELVCSNCRVNIRDHVQRPGDLATVALAMYQLLTHYGHHCTVQNYLPELREALAAAGVEVKP